MREIWRHPNFWANSIELTTSGCVIITTSWLHALLGIIHNAKHHKKYVKIKEIDSPSDIYRMKLPGTCSLSKENELLGTCSLSKESHEKKKKKKKERKKKENGTPILGEWDSYFLAGTPTFWLGLLLFTKRESRTPTFKILVRTLYTSKQHRGREI